MTPKDKVMEYLRDEEVLSSNLDWYNTDLPENKEAAKTLYKIGEVIKDVL